MKFMTQNPNFSLVLPGSCNAKCGFCFWKMDSEARFGKYLLHLDRALKALPLNFTQISITGGEPTCSPVIVDVLDLIREHRSLPASTWNKVVMTTNGYLLGNFIPKLKGAVDHVNISRHAIKDQDNEAIFGTKSVPDTETLAQLIFDLNKQGIDATLNVVLPSLEAPSETFLDDWSDFAKVIGASGVAFRIDHSLGLENLHADDISLKASGFTYQESSCPVCLTHTYRYRGAPMMFKYGISEPSDIQPYELVMQQNSDLTLDWAGKLPYNLEKDERIKPKKITYPAPTTGSPRRDRVAERVRMAEVLQMAAFQSGSGGSSCGSSSGSSCGSSGCGSGGHRPHSSCGSSGC